MSEHARRLKFPLRVGTSDSPNDDIAVLEADGSWRGDPEKLAAALGRMEGDKRSIEPLVMWLLLREMQRDRQAPAGPEHLQKPGDPPSD
jgi:hypothetical protein